jgi:hypothetical protein
MTGTSLTCPLCAASARRRRTFHNNSVDTLEQVVDQYIAFFKHAQFNAPVVPPFASTDGVHFDRQPLPEEREALVAYLRKL